MKSVGTESSYPLSPMQQGILFHSLYEQQSGLYIQQLLCAIHDELNVTAFVRAWKQLLDRHPTLRTSFHLDSVRGPVQEVHDKVDLLFEQQDWRDLDRHEQEARLAAHLLADRQRALKFDEAPLMRLSLFRFGEDEFRFVWTSHHALFDGRSRLLLLKEVSALYEDQKLKLPVARDYRDYIEWLDQKDLSGEESFWREELRDFDAPTALRLSPVTERSLEGHNEQKIHLTEDETSALQRFTQQHDLTMNSLLQGAWALLLSRYSGDENVLFGTTRSCRRSIPGGADSMIGLVINTIPLRVNVPGSKVVLDWLKELRAKHIALREYEHTPLVKIQEWSEVPKGLPLFDSLLVFENYQLEAALKTESTLWRNTEFQLIEKANYPLSILGYAGRELLLKVAYDQQRFDETTSAVLLRHLRTLLLSFVNNSGQKLREIELLTPQERQRLVIDWNRTSGDYPQPRCVHELFEAQVAQTPNAVALKSEDEEVSYYELNRRANQLAHYLQSLGVGPEQLVPVSVERSVEMVLALLAVMKAGAAYVPIDPEYPQERIAFVLEEIAANVVLTQRHLSPLLSDCSARVVNVDDRALFARETESTPANQAAPENLVYVIYTSGSTGRPKGVMVEHRGLRNLCEAQIRAFDLQPGRQALQFASLSFDASASEIFTTLLSGATLHLASKESLTTSLLALLRDRAITTVTLPPSLLAVLPNEDLPSLHTLISAGEACSKEIAARWSADHRFLNAYGPTEVSVCATIAECDGSTTPPLGNPINNAQVYLLDMHLQPVPFGVPGELYVGGAGLARGYVRSPELTAERFVPNPFSDAPGARLYKTGDLARVRPDGSVEFIGRIDHQIKARGFRIEPAEIEAVLSEHPALHASLVIVREDKPGNKQLVAYCVGAGESSPTPEVLREFLGRRLPAYMMPAAFILLDAFPLTPNGKIDRRALPSPDFSSKHFVAPRDRFEEAVASIWTELLGVRRVGVNDNFFELGGHSLLAMQVVSRLRETLEVELPLRSFFDKPTVEALAQHAQEALSSAETLSRIAKFESDEPPLASFAQQRLWLLDQLDSGNSAYNISRFLRLSGALDLSALEAALSELLRRHEALRTTFAAKDGQPRQIIAAPAPFKLPLIDLSDHPAAEREAMLRQLLQTEADRPFDLSQGPLFCAGLLRLAEREHVFFMNMHHIVSDGWSMMLLFKEFSALYSAALHQRSPGLTELPIQYADYAMWQREWLSGERLQEQLDYWRRQLETAPAVLELPTDYPRPAQQSYHGRTHRLNLDPQLVSRLKQFSQQSGCTLFMTLVAAFKVLLYRYTGSQDIVVGTPLAGRNRGELEGLIGFFVNTLVLRTDLSGNISFSELLGRVREVCLGAYAHQDLPFEKLVEELQPERSLGHMPLYQVMFSLLEVGAEPVPLEGLETTDLKIERQTTKSDLTLSLAEHDDGSFVGSLHYRDELFHADTIRRLADQYARVLHAVVDHPASRVAEVDLLEAGERRQLLEEWTEAEHDPQPQQCFHELFELQVERSPNAIALKSETAELSYNELNSQANQLAHYLMARGVGPEQPVGICVERSVEMIVALLAVMKAGAAYVPIDPDFPQQRITFILDETDAQIVLTSQHFRDRLPENVAVCLDTGWHSIAQHSTANPAANVDSDSAAYIIYTSGSTGRAKGVVVEHRQLVGYALAIAQKLSLEPGDKFAFLASFAADLSYTAIFPSLSTGGTLCVLSPSLGLDAVALSEYLQSNPIDHLKIVPSHLRALLDLSTEKAAIIPKKRLVLGGEASSWELIEEVERLNPNCRITNHYGPTETTVGVLTYDVSRESPTMRKAGVPLGRPLPNTESYILDPQLQPVPIRTPGELYIGGNSLARGYLARPDLTAERFIPHPFGKVPGARLYRTGDNARYLPDGNLEYLGRSDHQVKLRGFRVELGEIEAVLAQHPSVREAVVILREAAPGDQRLVAYFVPREGAESNHNGLPSYLRQTLPEYMIPSAFVALEEIPRTSSGKVDRHSLPVSNIARRATDRDFVQPRTPIEKIVAGVFSQTLNVDQVGAEDNFFELGGHSLLAMQVISRLREMLRVEVPLRSLFEAPTVAQLSTQILARESTTGQTEKIARIIMRLHDANSHPST